MSKTLKITLTKSSLDNAVRYFRDYQKRLESAGNEIAKRLSQMGYEVAFRVLENHVYTGETIGNLEVVQTAPNTYVLRTESTAILFLEFGTGVTKGYGHPEVGKYGQGTYPSTAKVPHWDDPNGWWYPTDDPQLTIYTDKSGQGWAHTYGIAPQMPFYQAYMAMKINILKVAREVLGDGNGD